MTLRPSRPEHRATPRPDAGLDGPDNEDADAGVVPDGTVRIQEFTIDIHEVTNLEYDTYLDEQATAAHPTPLSSACQWKADAGSAQHATCNRQLGDQRPANCIDWCDADRFCRAHGKRLCGARGGGPTTRTDMVDRTKSQWMRACGGTSSAMMYPYGPTPQPQFCQTYDRVLDAGPDADAEVVRGSVDVMSLPDCVGSDPQLHDMSGNVQEWEDNCDPLTGGAADESKALCYLRGGGYLSGALSSSCTYVSLAYQRSLAEPNVGFRCCSP